jgi:hypothetical protein
VITSSDEEKTAYKSYEMKSMQYRTKNSIGEAFDGKFGSSELAFNCSINHNIKVKEDKA